MNNISRLVVLVVVLLAFNSRLTAQPDTVKMFNNYFEPETIRVNKGETIVWINKMKTIHTTTSGKECSKDGIWNSGNMEKGEIFKYTFNESGVFPYYCIPHCLSGMKGVVYAGTGYSEAVSEQTNPRTAFTSTRIINNHSVNTLSKRVLDFRITHRFDDIGGERGGFHSFYGLDNIRDVRIGFDYGITDRLMAGIGRSKGDRFNFEVQQVQELYNLFLKYQVLKEDKDQPLSFTILGNTVYSAVKTQDRPTTEANFASTAERFSYSFQALIAKVITPDISFQIMPTYIKRNWALKDANKDLFALGSAIRWTWTDLLGIIVEYNYLFPSDYTVNDIEIKNPLGIALEIDTGAHVFHVNFTNSTGIINETYLPYTTSSWSDGEFRFGFTISRLFNL